MGDGLISVTVLKLRELVEEVKAMKWRGDDETAEELLSLKRTKQKGEVRK